MRQLGEFQEHGRKADLMTRKVERWGTPKAPVGVPGFMEITLISILPISTNNHFALQSHVRVIR